MSKMHKAAIMGACAASTVALNVSMQHFTSGSCAGGESGGNDSDDDDYLPTLLADNMNAQFVALACAAGEMTGAEAFGAEVRGENSCSRHRSAPHWWDLFVWEQEDDEKWRSLLGISSQTFGYICRLVRPDLESPAVRRVDGGDLTAEKQVAVALRRLRSGDSAAVVGALFALESGVVSTVTGRFIRSLIARARHHLKWPEGQDMESVKGAFENLTGFRNCCGVVGLARFRLSLPSDASAEQWVDSAGNATMLSQAIVDTNLRFLDVCIGWPGSSDEATVLQNSTFYRLCEGREKLNGPGTFLDAVSVSEYVLGSVAHPLRPWLITPYPEGIITHDGRFFDRTPMQTTFNEQHEAGRVFVDRAFAHLKGAWRILHKAKHSPNTQKLSNLIFGCCLLHNIFLDQEESTGQDVVLLDEVGDEGYSPGHVNQYADSEGWQLRDILAEHFLASDGPRD